MAIIVNLEVMLAKRRKKLNELSEFTGISVPNLSILKTGKAKAIRFSTLDAICTFFDCDPGEILQFLPDDQVPDDIPAYFREKRE